MASRAPAARETRGAGTEPPSPPSSFSVAVREFR